MYDTFSIRGLCCLTRKVFLGDYVDRGYHSIETVSLIMSLKVFSFLISYFILLFY